MTFNPMDYAHIVRPVGVDLGGTLGCLMLDVEVPPIDFPEEYLYTSSNPEKWWVNGKVWDREPHLTVKYGFVQNANYYRPQIEALLDDHDFGDIKVERWGVFDQDSTYSCIVAHIEKTPGVLEANQRMSLLPHVDTYPDYNPHVTFAYVPKKHVGKALRLLPDVSGLVLHPVGLNFGKQ